MKTYRAVRGLDDDLLTAAGYGDQGAFAMFYDRTVAWVFGVLHHVLGEPARAADATGRVYLHLWRTASGHGRPGQHPGDRRVPVGRSAYCLLLAATGAEITAARARGELPARSASATGDPR